MQSVSRKRSDEAGKRVECKSACLTVIARQEQAGFRKTFVAERAEIVSFTEDQGDLFSLKGNVPYLL